MAEFFEVRTTIEGHERAAELAHELLLTGLATSIDIAELPHQAPGRDGTAWQLTLIAAERHVSHLEQRIKATNGSLPIDTEPVAHDMDDYPDWLTNDQS